MQEASYTKEREMTISDEEKDTLEKPTDSPTASSEKAEPLPIVAATATPVKATATPQAKAAPEEDVVVRTDMGREPVKLDDCPFCGATGQTTKVDQECDSGTWLFSVCCCFVCWPCSFLPLCVKSVSFFCIIKC